MDTPKPTRNAKTFNAEKFFDGILDRIQKENKSSTPMESVFYNVLNSSMNTLLKDCPFITYLNIFNTVGKGNTGNIEFYADFINDKITSDRREMVVDKEALFNNDTNTLTTISILFKTRRKFGESFEYRLRSDAPKILQNKYHVRSCSNDNKYDYSKDLKELLQTNNSREPFNNWLSVLKTCYEQQGKKDTTTHFFLVNGPIYFGFDKMLETDLFNYVVNANIGVSLKDDNQSNIHPFIRQFKKFIEQITFNLIVDIKNYQMRQAAVSAAIAQVMARNMSHNFGSHVLSNLISDKVYENLRDAAVQSDLEMLKYFALENDLFKENENHQLQYFFQYLKSRMDYLSEVTFGVSNLLTTKMVYNDVMKELDQVRILLNYISGVSDFKYQFQILHNNNKIDLTTENDIGIAFPSDVLGCQAFYNIIENIIRNTAKHSKPTQNGETLIFTINIRDNFANTDDLKDIEGINELYCVEIDNGVAENDIDTLINGTNDKKGLIDFLNDSVLDEYNNLRSHSLGLLEMKSSAAFLRQIDLPEIVSDDYFVDKSDSYYHERNGQKRLNILKAFKTDNGHLGYRFFVQKPKEILLVGDDWRICTKEENENEEQWKEKEENIRKQLLNYGIQIIKTNEFKTAMKEGVSFAHQFLLYSTGVSQAVNAKEYETLLPLRKIPVNHDEMVNILTSWFRKESDTVPSKSKENNNLKGEIIIEQLKKWAWTHYYKDTDPDQTLIKGAYDNSYKYQVIFLNHGKDFQMVKNDIIKDIDDNIITEAWIENMKSKTYGKLPEFYKLSNGRGKPLSNYINHSNDKIETKLELLEAYHNKVIIIDERVQRYAAKNNEDNISCMDLFLSTNVFCPSPNDIPLDPANVLTNNLGANLNKYIEDNIQDAFLLIHYGILERIYGRNEKAIETKLKGWVKSAKRVIVTSGRGAHSLNLPDSVCFVNLSSVLYAFTENRNKYLINYLLNQSRRKKICVKREKY